MQLEKKESTEAEDAYTAGMLHDAGRFMLANSMPEKFQEALTLAAEQQLPLVEAEQEIFGASHAGRLSARPLGLARRDRRSNRLPPCSPPQ